MRVGSHARAPPKVRAAAGIPRHVLRTAPPKEGRERPLEVAATARPTMAVRICCAEWFGKLLLQLIVPSAVVMAAVVGEK